MEKYLSPVEDASANSPNLVGHQDFPYPIPAELAKEFDPLRFGKLWRRNRPTYFEEQYLDPTTGEPTWDYPFFFSMTGFWLTNMTHLLKMLQNEITQSGCLETEALMLSVSRAFDDFRGIYDFTDETWKYDPMIREEILGEAPVSPDTQPVKTDDREACSQLREIPTDALNKWPRTRWYVKHSGKPCPIYSAAGGYNTIASEIVAMWKSHHDPLLKAVDFLALQLNDVIGDGGGQDPNPGEGLQGAIAAARRSSEDLYEILMFIDSLAPKSARVVEGEDDPDQPHR